jgi:hypothetical protein
LKVQYSVTPVHVRELGVVRSSATATPVVVAFVDVLNVMSSDPRILEFVDLEGSHVIAPKKYGKEVAMRVTVVEVREAGEASAMRYRYGCDAGSSRRYSLKNKILDDPLVRVTGTGIRLKTLRRTAVPLELGTGVAAARQLPQSPMIVEAVNLLDVQSSPRMQHPLFSATAPQPLTSSMRGKKRLPNRAVVPAPFTYSVGAVQSPSVVVTAYGAVART